MSAARTVAVREWKWLAKNPFLLIRKPADTKPRDRVISTEEMERLDRAATSPMQRHVIRAAYFALETGLSQKRKHSFGTIRHGNDAPPPLTKQSRPILRLLRRNWDD